MLLANVLYRSASITIFTYLAAFLIQTYRMNQGATALPLLLVGLGPLLGSLLGGYVGLTVIWRTGSFVLAVLLGALTISLVGIAQWNAFLKRLSGQELGQVLTTMGFALIFQDLALLIWGGDPYNLPVPAALSGGLRLGGAVFPVYRIFIVGVAVAVGLGLWLLLDRTRAR